MTNEEENILGFMKPLDWIGNRIGDFIYFTLRVADRFANFLTECFINGNEEDGE